MKNAVLVAIAVVIFDSIDQRPGRCNVMHYHVNGSMQVEFQREAL